MTGNPISPTIPFDQDGIHHGFLCLPYSRDDSAWGSVMIPITVARNGDGPTALLTGGSHGDEYEGPIALFDLAATIRAEDVTGRIIIVPAMNYPALADAIVQFSVPEFEYPRSDLATPVHFVGPVSLAAASPDLALPDWWGDLDGSRPVVHVTQGTVANASLDGLVLPTLAGVLAAVILEAVLTPEARAAQGMTEGFFRVSVGLEDPDALIARLRGPAAG
mgnify:CR=1 FL=1